MNTFGLSVGTSPSMLSILHFLTSNLCDLGGGPFLARWVEQRSSSKLGSHSDWSGGLSA